MKTHISTVSAILIFSLLSIKSGYTAEINHASPSSAAQIVINNALIQSASGTKNFSLRLIAQDHNNLSVGQRYQAHIGAAATENQQDARYSQLDEVIFIPTLLENGIPAHQTTLILENRKKLLFRIIEDTPLSSSTANQFFDPKGIRNLIYTPE